MESRSPPELDRGRLARAWRAGRRAAAALAVLFLATGVAPGAIGAAAAEPASLAALRFGQQGRFTRVVLELDRQLPVEARLERAPARLVIDLPGLPWPGVAPTAPPRGLARTFVLGRLDPAGTSLAVELAAPAEFVARFWIPPGRDRAAWRFVVDLEPEGATRRVEPAAAGPVPPLPRARPEAAARAHRAAVQAAEIQPAAAPAEPPAPRNGTLALPAERHPVIAVDPGHGGIDPGTIGVDGVKEKDIVLAVGLELARVLEASGRYRAVLTRRDDVGLALRERIKVARDAGAQLFVSLHADSIADPEVAGASVYTLSETASDEEAALLAAKENKADILTSTDLSRHDPIVASILIDLAQRDTLNKSIELAEALSAELQKVTPLLRRHRRYAGFAVLKSPEMPSVLIELGYLSSAADARRLDDPQHRYKLARAILAAIDRYQRTLR